MKELKKVITIRYEVWMEGREVSPSGLESTPNIGILQDVEAVYDEKRGVWVVNSLPDCGEFIFHGEGEYLNRALVDWIRHRVGFDA